MKGIYKGTLVEITEQDDHGYTITSNFGPISASKDEVLEVPNKVYAEYVYELQQIEDYRENIRKKQEEIRERYYAKKQELDNAATKAWVRRQAIIREIKAKALCY